MNNYIIDDFSKKIISIDATDISVILNLNNYNNNIYKIILKYWKKCDYLDYNNIVTEIENEDVEFHDILETEDVDIKDATIEDVELEDIDIEKEYVKIEDEVFCFDTFEEEINKNMTADETIIDICERENISYKFENRNDINKFTENIIAIGNGNPKINLENTTSFCNKQMGIQFENLGIKKYEKKHKVKVNIDTSYYSRTFKNDSEYIWKIGGRLDGILNNNKIIEVKNRRNVIFPCIPIREIIQIYAYMFIKNIDKVTLVEVSENDYKETNFKYSNGYEFFILGKLKTFCLLMENFMKDTNKKKEYAKYKDIDIEDENIKKINEELYKEIIDSKFKKMKISNIKSIIFGK